MESRWLGVVWAASFFTGCGKGQTAAPGRTTDQPTCSDADGDGFGIGEACDGPDCNDDVAWVHLTEECDRLCEETEAPIPECGCDPAAHREPETCYLADDPATA